MKKKIIAVVVLSSLLISSVGQANLISRTLGKWTGNSLAEWVGVSAALHVIAGWLWSGDLKQGGKATTKPNGTITKEANVTWVDIVDQVPTVKTAPDNVSVTEGDVRAIVEKDSASKARFPWLHKALNVVSPYPPPNPNTPSGSKITFQGNYITTGPVTEDVFACGGYGGPIGGDIQMVVGGYAYFSGGSVGAPGCASHTAAYWYKVPVSPTNAPTEAPASAEQYASNLNKNSQGASDGSAPNGDAYVDPNKYSGELDDLIHSYPNIVHFDDPPPPTPTQAEIDKAWATTAAKEAATAANTTATASSATAQSAAQKASQSAAAASAATAASKSDPNNPYKAQQASIATALAARDAAAAVTAATQAVKDAEKANAAVTDYINKGGTDEAIAVAADQATAAANAAAAIANASGRQAAASASAQAAVSSAAAATSLRNTANQLAQQAAANPNDTAIAQQAAAAAAAADRAEAQAATAAAQATKDAEAASAAEETALKTARGSITSGAGNYDTSIIGLPESKSITNLITSFVADSPLAVMVRSFTVSTSGAVSSVSCGTFYGTEIKFDFARYQDTLNTLGGVLLVISHGFAVLIVIRGWK